LGKNPDQRRKGELLMNEKQEGKTEPRQGRMEALRELPGDVLKTLSKEEISAFLFDEVWPDSLQEKLKDYLLEQD
jgi:hypothetical protein